MSPTALYVIEMAGNDVRDACLTPNVAPFTCENPDNYRFWDGIHPTKAGHAILAEEAARAVR